MELKTKEVEKEISKIKSEGTIVKRKLSDLKAYKNNAKIHTTDQISKIRDSIQSFGYKDLIAVDENNVIIEGHGRLQALYQLDSTGSKEISVVQITDLNENEKKAYRIAHNKLSLMTDFDEEKLGSEFNSLEDTDSFNDTGFSNNEITDIWDKDKEAVDDDFEIPTEPKYTISQGDTWQLGNHRLRCGDSTKKDHVDALMCEKKADMVFTDPPYNVNIGGSGAMPIERQSKEQQAMAKKAKKYPNDLMGRLGQKTIQNDNMSREEFIQFTTDYLSRYFENCDGPYYIFMSCKEWGTLMNKFEELGGYWSSTIIWNKSQFVLSRKDYHPKFEPILYGWKVGANINHLADRSQGDVWEFDKPSNSKLHPTMKPIDLCSKAINNSSKRDNLILDLFGGSGSTLIACEQLNRKCFMMELDPKYCSVIIERWEKLTGKAAVKVTELDND